MTSELQLADAMALKPIGLRFPPGMGFKQWQDIGTKLFQAHDYGTRYVTAVRWAIGDWLRYGEFTYGEKYAQAVEMTGLAEQRLMNVAWVAGRIPISRRAENLSFKHHAIVAPLSPIEQAHYLAQAETHGWSTRRLYEEIQRGDDELIGAAPGESLAIRLLDRATRAIGLLDPDFWAHKIAACVIEPLGKLDVDPARYTAFLRALRDRIDELLKGETK